MHKGTNLVKVSSDNVDVPGQRLEIVVGLLGAEVTGAEDVLDLPWDQQLLELGWQSVASMGDVKVSKHQYQLTGNTQGS